MIEKDHRTWIDFVLELLLGFFGFVIFFILWAITGG